jgi:3-oxoacyl-[acyl-carrier protein] reductase
MNEDPRLFAGRVALITGASHGIGAATARLLASLGAAVAVNYHRDASAAAAVADDIRAAAGRAVPFGADVTDPEAVGRLVAGVTTGLGPIDVLVLNAAGIIRPARAPFLEMDQDVLERAVLAQLRAVVLPARAVGAAMAAARAGSIVVVSSGLARDPQPGFADLVVAKAAVEGAARAMARELGPHGVRVNVVAAGPTLTRATAWAGDEDCRRWAARTPLGRNATPADVAGAVALLASPLAGFCTGAYLPANGGVIMP